MMVLRKPLTAIISILVFILLLGSCTVAFSPLKLGSCCCCCYSVLKELTSPPDYCIAGFSSQESTLGGGVAHKLIVLHNGISGGFRYRSSSCKRLSLSTSVWERHRNGKSKQPRGLDFSCGAFCISTPSPSNGNHSWRLWQGVVSAVMKHIIPRVPQRTLNLIACITAAELAKKEAKVQINALPLELQPKAMVLYNDSVTLLRSYALQLTEMDWDVRRFVMQEWDAWRNRSESRMMISSFVWNDVVEPSASGPGIIARDIARLYGEAAVMGVVTRTSNISSFLESTFFRLLAQVAKTDQEALDSAVVKKLENLGVSALTVSEFFDLCSGGRIPKQIVENILRIFTEEEVIVSPSHSRDHVADGRSEICDTLTLHEMWDKLKLHSSNGQNATTRAATRAVRSLRSNSIDMVCHSRDILALFYWLGWALIALYIFMFLGY